MVLFMISLQTVPFTVTTFFQGCFCGLIHPRVKNTTIFTRVSLIKCPFFLIKYVIATAFGHATTAHYNENVCYVAFYFEQ